MQYISLTNTSLTYFTTKGEISELSGSSKYNVFNNEIVSKEKSKKGKIENTTATLDYLKSKLTDNMTGEAVIRLMINYTVLWQKCKREKFTNENDLTRLEVYESALSKVLAGGSDFLFKYKLVGEMIAQANSRYQTRKRVKKEYKQINKTKVKSKMYALFNLKNSRKFMAFYSVSFPLDSSDDQCFECWNYFLTACRKRFNLLNYVWVTERQKNGTLHFHMLTNNWLPIQIVNRIMAIIIDNKVKLGLMYWGSSSIDRFNGVDVDSIFNSKRHKKTGKQLNQSQVREWVSKYVTKYVTKNTEKFLHLCWHCSRSVSMLFTSSILLLEESRKVTDFLPRIREMYLNYKSEFNNTWVFKFIPPEHLFERIRMYNDWLSVEYEPQRIFKLNNITFKTTSL